MILFPQKSAQAYSECVSPDGATSLCSTQKAQHIGGLIDVSMIIGLVYQQVKLDDVFLGLHEMRGVNVSSSDAAPLPAKYSRPL